MAVARAPILGVHALITQRDVLGAEAADRIVALTFAVLLALGLFWAVT
jgi:hypothetical protein